MTGKMPEPHICPVGVVSYKGLTVIYDKNGDPNPRLLGGAKMIPTLELLAAIDADKHHKDPK